MMKVKTILVDDEPLALMEMQQMLKKHPEIDIVAVATNAEEAISKIKELNPQLIFLDINMPEKTGFDLLEELEEAPHVIFVTAYDEFALKAFEVNALDYVLKPVNPTRLAEVVEKVIKLISLTKANEQKISIDKKIFIKDGNLCFIVPLNEVHLIESVGNYARFFYQQHRPMLHKSLNYLEEKLPESHFFRASRQHIVNIHYIKKIIPYHNNTLQIELQNGLLVDVSQRQSIKFKDIMGI